MRQQYLESPRRRPTVLKLPLLVMLMAIPLFAEAALAQTDDIFMYPAKGQSQAQQDRDRYECHSWAARQTGFDPSKATPPPMPASPPPNATAPSTYQPSQRHIVRGAGRGAALGAVGGAIAGDAGKGAAAGAAMGGLAGGFRRRDERRQQYAAQQSAQQQNAQQQYAQQQAAQQSAQGQRAAYNRAMAACLQGRGYTVN
jgi:hypothetical protein